MFTKPRMLLAFLATLVGGFAFLLFTKISRDILFDGLPFCSSSTPQLMLGTTTMVSAAITAGFMTSLIVVRKSYVPHLLISGYVIFNLWYLASCGAWGIPLLFETILAFLLIAGIWVGDAIAKKFPLAPV